MAVFDPSPQNRYGYDHFDPSLQSAPGVFKHHQSYVLDWLQQIMKYHLKNNVNKAFIFKCFY